MAGATPIDAQAPIGVFDSGVGGLSVLRHVRAGLSHEDLIYFSDALHAPYGGRGEAHIEARALAIGAFLVAQGVKAIVVACNTATAVAITALRSAYPALLVVGVEPGLKPAAALSRNGVVGVLATEATLASQKFAGLRDQVAAASGVRFVLQPCPGLADLIETGALDSPQLRSMLRTYLAPLVAQRADTIVLGCTHYPFVAAQIEALLLMHAQDAKSAKHVTHVTHATLAHPARDDESAVTMVDTGAAVARQLEHVLRQHAAGHGNDHRGRLAGFTNGVPGTLDAAFSGLLGMQVISRQA